MCVKRMVKSLLFLLVLSIIANSLSFSTVVLADVTAPKISSPSNGADIEKDSGDVKVRWSSVPKAWYYISVREEGKSKSVFNNNNDLIDDTSIYIPADVLEYGTDYEVFVTAETSNGKATSKTVEFSVKDLPAPKISSPSNGADIDKDSGDVKVRWSSVSKAWYYISVREEGESKSVFNNNNDLIDDTSIYIPADVLEYGTDYEVFVTAETSNGKATSKTVEFSVKDLPAPKISSPSNGADIEKDSGDVKVRWSSVPKAWYYISVREEGKSKSVFNNNNDLIDDTSIYIPADVLEYGTDYEVFVTAETSNGKATSKTVEFSVKDLPAPKISSPSNGADIDKDSGDLEIRWSSVPKAWYYISVREEGESKSVFNYDNQIINNTNIDIPVSMLEYGMEYEVFVTAETNEGKAQSGVVRFSVKSAPTPVTPSAPVISQPFGGQRINKDSGELRVCWSSVPKAWYYISVREEGESKSVFNYDNQLIKSTYIDIPMGVLEYGSTYEVFVTAESSGGTSASKSVEFSVNGLPDPIYPTSVKLDKTGTTMSVGKTLKLEATVSPDNLTNDSLIWTSTDESVATVDYNGNVTAVGMGTTSIIVETVNGKSAKCTIIVADLSIIKVNGLVSSLSVDFGRMINLRGTLSSVENIKMVSVTVNGWNNGNDGIYATLTPNSKSINLNALAIDASSPPFNEEGSYTVCIWAKTDTYLNPVKPVATIKITIKNSRKITVTVKCDGKLIEDAQLILNNDPINFTKYTTSGVAEFSPVMADSHSLKIICEGYKDYSTVVHTKSKDAEISVNLTGKYSISGFIKDGTKGIQGIDVYLDKQNDTKRKCRTKGDGYYEFKDVNNGIHEVIVENNAYAPNPAKLGVTVNNSSISNQNIVLVKTPKQDPSTQEGSQIIKYFYKDKDILYLAFSSIIYSKQLETEQKGITLGSFYSKDTVLDSSERGHERIWVRYENETHNKVKEDLYWADLYNLTINQWILMDTKSNWGFFAAAFLNPQNNHIVIAYRGTQDYLDMATDAQLAYGDLDQQFVDAISFYEKVNKTAVANNYDIECLTGHSLGGALANYVSIVKEIPAVSFNAPAITYQAYSNIANKGIKTTGVFRGIDKLLFRDHANTHDTAGLLGESWTGDSWDENVDRNTIVHECLNHDAPRVLGGGLLRDIFAHDMESMLTIKNNTFVFTDTINPKKKQTSWTMSRYPYLTFGVSILGTTGNDDVKDYFERFSSISFNSMDKITTILNIFSGRGNDIITISNERNAEYKLFGGPDNDIYRIYGNQKKFDTISDYSGSDTIELITDKSGYKKIITGDYLFLYYDSSFGKGTVKISRRDPVEKVKLYSPTNPGKLIYEENLQEYMRN